MKTHPMDFFLSALAMGLLAGLALTLVLWLVAPVSAKLLGNYHVVVDGLFFVLLYGLCSALLVRIILRIQPLRAGTYAMDDIHFTYWKFFTVIHEFGRGALLPLTTVFAKPLIGKLFGAKIGRNTAMGGQLVDPPLITVGDNAILGLNSALVAHAITSGNIILRPVTIGPNATIGVHAVVMPGVDIGEGAVVTAGSVVTMDTKIPPFELWGGIPARKIKDLTPTDIRG